jgi:hypothetical protein
MTDGHRPSPALFALNHDCLGAGFNRPLLDKLFDKCGVDSHPDYQRHS